MITIAPVYITHMISASKAKGENNRRTISDTIAPMYISHNMTSASISASKAKGKNSYQ